MFNSNLFGATPAGGVAVFLRFVAPADEELGSVTARSWSGVGGLMWHVGRSGRRSSLGAGWFDLQDVTQVFVGKRGKKAKRNIYAEIEDDLRAIG